MAGGRQTVQPGQQVGRPPAGSPQVRRDGQDPAAVQGGLRRQAQEGNQAVRDRQQGQQDQSATPAAAESVTPYVDLSNRSQKAQHLVGLMDESQALLQQNGVSDHMTTKLAAVMTNEGGRNQRRANLATGFQRDATTLSQKLGGKDPLAVQADPAALAKLEASLSEDERAVFEAVKDGRLDLADLSSPDDEKKKAAQETLTGVGITHRANQYEEMEGLRTRKEGGEKLGKEDKARLSTLQGISGAANLGMGDRMGDLWGMSKERFAEIYREGQERFEPAQYTGLRDSYIRNEKRQKQPSDEVELSSGIGSFKADADMQGKLGTSYDLVADMATSYGTAQIMGAYAQQGLLSAKDERGEDDKVSLDELKASGQRLSPTQDDVHQQLAFFNMKGIDLGSRSLSDSALTQSYNGSSPGSPLYQQYMAGLSAGTGAWNTAKRRQ